MPTRSPASPAASLQYLQEKSIAATAEFKKNYPELATWISEEQLLSPLSQQEKLAQLQTEFPPPPELTLEQKKLFTEISQEEHQSIMQKMQDLVRLPIEKLDPELELYLEQQLADLLGFSLTAELEGYRLPTTTGSIQSLPYFKSSPTDSSASHTEVPEAPFSGKRSYFGWTPVNNYSKEVVAAGERYGVALPLFSLPTWTTESFSLKKWYSFRKVLVINPIDYRAVVAAVTDIYLPTSAKYQLGGSPGLIRAGNFWSPSAQGRVLIFFVSDESPVPFGPKDLFYR